MIKDIITNQYFLLALTFGIYQGAKMLQRKTGSILLNPILIAIGLIILFLTTFNIPYETYYESGKMIDFWLKPAVVALGVPLYLQLSQIKKQFLPILISRLGTKSLSPPFSSRSSLFLASASIGWKSLSRILQLPPMQVFSPIVIFFRA